MTYPVLMDPIQMDAGIGIVMITVGIVVLFTGKLLLRAVSSVGFGLAVAYFVYIALRLLGFGELFRLMVFSLVFITVAPLGWTLFKVSYALTFSCLFYVSMATYSPGHIPLTILLLIGILVITVAYLVAEYLIEIASLIVGSLMIYVGIVLVSGNIMFSLLLISLLLILRFAI